MQTHSDVLGLSLILPNETESVLLGAAMLGASAAEKSGNESATVTKPDYTTSQHFFIPSYLYYFITHIISMKPNPKIIFKKPLHIQYELYIVYIIIIFWLQTTPANEDSILESVIRRMEGQGLEFNPDPKLSKFHDKKFEVFLEMYNDQIKYRKMMTGY